MKTVKCLALMAFTHFVLGFGQVHGDPDSSDKKVREPHVPEEAVEFLVDGGRIEAPEVDAPAGTFAMSHIKFGNYLITGPGVEPDTIIKGKKDAEAYLALLRESEGGDEQGPPA